MDAPDPTTDTAMTGADPAEAAGRRLPWREAALIGLLALSLNLAGNGRASLWDRDEPRYAGCTREMRQSGDLINPTFNAEPRYHKPVLIYWLMLAGTALGGDNPFGARLVSSVAGMGVCLMTWALGRRLFGPKEGRWAALALATAPIMVAESKLATTDATLLVWFVGAQWAIWELSQKPSRLATAAFWSCMALSVLTKGPVGPALIVAASGLTWWFGGPTLGYRRLLAPLWPDASGLDEGLRFREAIARGGIAGLFSSAITAVELTARVAGRWLASNWGVLLFLAIALPWYVAIGIASEGAFFSVAWGYHVIKRATESIETHGGFPGYYVALTIPLLYPWSALLPAGIAGLWRRRKASMAAAFVLGWIVGPLLLLEVARTKIIHYYLPAYPACALVVGWLVVALSRSEVNLRRWTLGGTSLGLLAGLGVALTVGSLAGAVAFPGGLRWSCLAFSAVVGVGTFYAVERLRGGSAERAASALVGSWAAALLIFGAAFLPSVEPYRLPQKVAAALDEVEREEGAVPVLASFKPPGIVYSIGHPVPELLGRAGADLMARREGPLVSALLPVEVEALRQHPRLEVEERGTIRGFNIERFKNEELTLAVIRPKPGSISPDGGPAPSVARGRRVEGRGAEPTLVE
ncbi:ArnT family glycosyltransferase [Tautonia plasticadhaerens]|uniref:Undecaprenyl phosphate-alpha-4-amino-4-deoxy-L-arabinose arabinosyl transferase n=1 Tax=Tautonia plasticadhaerens TaxID=2527974 RepID=A0A518GWN9_9BACT|nr:Undecaprenyl phosphate-alpha-4-amino-4-deoxy-L-arabinose arabinosyl transferase [Tautonia plasticadhaerens]